MKSICKPLFKLKYRSPKETAIKFWEHNCKMGFTIITNMAHLKTNISCNRIRSNNYLDLLSWIKS